MKRRDASKNLNQFRFDFEPTTIECLLGKLIGNEYLLHSLRTLLVRMCKDEIDHVSNIYYNTAVMNTYAIIPIDTPPGLSIKPAYMGILSCIICSCKRKLVPLNGMRFSHQNDPDGSPTIVIDMNDIYSNNCLVIKPFSFRDNHVWPNDPVVLLKEKTEVISEDTSYMSYCDLEHDEELDVLYDKIISYEIYNSNSISKEMSPLLPSESDAFATARGGFPDELLEWHQ